MGLHAFLAMPRGMTQGMTQLIDCEAIRADLILPALALAGCELLADADAGDRRRPEDVHQRLLADLVIVDTSTDQARSCQERGLQNALLARAILYLQGSEEQPALPATLPEPTLPYHLHNGKPDPTFLAADRQALAQHFRSLLNNDESASASDESASAEGRTSAPPGRAYPGPNPNPNPARTRGSRFRDTALSFVDQRRGDWTTPGPIQQVLLFSGHMIDHPERREPRFPASMTQAVAEAIAAKLDELGVGRHDLAICGGACGGDLLFAEAALARGCRVQLHLQFNEPAFLQASVAFAGEHWIDRYHSVRNHPLTRLLIQPDELGPPAKGLNPYVRNNLWQLYTALACGADTLRFVALWDGLESPNPGGTQNMIDIVHAHDGQVSTLNIGRLSEPTPAMGETTDKDSETATHALP